MADNYESPATHFEHHEAPPPASRFATRDAIFGMDDRRYEELFIPEWDMKVKVRSLTAGERDRYEVNSIEEKSNGNRSIKMRNLRSRMVVLVTCDEHCRPLFRSEDVDMLSGRSAAALQRIFEVGQRLAGMTKEDVDELAGNSETPDDDSDSV